MSFIVLQIGWQQALVTYKILVDEGNACNPVTMLYFSLALDVVLTSCEVPHEIAPVHVVQLIDKEELDVIPLGRNLDHQHFSALIIWNLSSFYSSQPVFISFGMIGTPHTREKHVLCILIFCFVTYYFVAVLFIRTFLFFTLVYRCTFGHIVSTSAIHFFQRNF